MTEEQWKQVRHIVSTAIDMPHGERTAYLDKACLNLPEIREEVDSLLAVEEPARTFIEVPVVVRDEEFKESHAFVEEGTRIGPYEIIREIGRGGMARVYEALRNDEVKIRVAIKVVQPRFLNREEVD